MDFGEREAPYLLMTLRCTEPGKSGRYSVVLFDTFKNGWRAAAAVVPVDEKHYVSDWRVDGKSLNVSISKIGDATGEPVTTRFTWAGNDLVGN